MSGEEGSLSIEANEIRASLGLDTAKSPLPIRTTEDKTLRGTRIAKNVSPIRLNIEHVPDAKFEGELLTDTDEIRAELVEALQLMQPGITREEMAEGLNGFGQRIADDVNANTLIFPTQKLSLHVGEDAGQIPPAGNVDFSGIDKMVLALYQQGVASFIHSKEPLTIGKIRSARSREDLVDVNDLNSRLRWGDVVFAKAILERKPLQE